MLPLTTAAFPINPLVTCPLLIAAGKVAPEARWIVPILPLVIFPLLTLLFPISPLTTMPEAINPKNSPDAFILANTVPETFCHS